MEHSPGPSVCRSVCRTFWGEVGTSHCNQWRETLLLSCVEVREPIELPFRVVSGVGPGINVWNGSPRASRRRGGFWRCLPPLDQ